LDFSQCAEDDQNQSVVVGSCNLGPGRSYPKGGPASYEFQMGSEAKDLGFSCDLPKGALKDGQRITVKFTFDLAVFKQGQPSAINQWVRNSIFIPIK